MLEQGYEVVNGKVRLPCLWKEGEPDLPSNYDYAKHRATTLTKSKSMRDKKIRAAYDDTFVQWEKEGIIKRVIDLSLIHI